MVYITNNQHTARLERAFSRAIASGEQKEYHVRRAIYKIEGQGNSFALVESTTGNKAQAGFNSKADAIAFAKRMGLSVITGD